MDRNKHTYCLSGKVLPERAVVNLPLTVKVVASPEGSMPSGWEVVVSTVRSQLAVTLTTPEPIDDLDEMRERMEGIARFCIDTLGFLLACGYDIELTQVVGIDPLTHNVFGVDVQGVRNREQYTDGEILTRFQSILGVAPHKQQPLRRALVDFREAIRSHEDTAFFCFRAMEDLRQRFVSGEDDDPKKTWREMARIMAVPEDTVNYVWKELRPAAMSVRHGAAIKLDRASRTKMLKVTWDLVDRIISAEIPGPNTALNRTGR
ncbi:MAG: hypothetical protein ACYC9L_16920 [Sulfuricaulis sp.]